MIEAVRALDAQLEAMRERLRSARRSGSQRAWEDAVVWFRREAAQWNALVLAHNLKAPAATFQRLKIDSDAEIARIIEAATS